MEPVEAFIYKLKSTIVMRYIAKILFEEKSYHGECYDTKEVDVPSFDLAEINMAVIKYFSRFLFL